ncbi:MAG: Fis family transcriptional regulator, partial [Hydrocarboniphaga effusa]|nr:Fis family transcriptional regulator [Hydrocarboniphaga effusa]
MCAQKTSDTKPLNQYVANSLDSFFKALNGHAPKDLY